MTEVNEVGSYPHEVEENMNNLLYEVNTYKGDDYFTVGCYFHAMFENIHPFANGNGRVGRTLMNYYFMIHEIAPVIIYDEDKKEYYKCLEEFANHDNLDMLKEFIIYEQNKTWEEKKSMKKSMKQFDI